MKKNDNVIWLLPTILIFVVLLMIKFCTPRLNEKFIVEPIKRENLELFIDTQGKAEAKDFVTIGLNIQLGVDKVYFKEGDKVSKGDVIIRFSEYKEKELDNKLNDRREALAVKQSQLRYLIEQEKQKVDVSQQMQQLRGEVEALQIEAAKLLQEKQLVQRVVFSPIDGYIVKINVLEGGVTDTSAPVLILAKSYDLKITSDPVKSEKLKYITIGNEAEMQSTSLKNSKDNRDGNSNTFNATLYKINDIGVDNLKTLEFLTVPLTAIVKKNSKAGIKCYVYFIDKDNKVTEQEVQIGINNGEKIEIYGNGIKEGQEIIVNPNEKLQNNIIVQRRSLVDEKREKEKRLSL